MIGANLIRLVLVAAAVLATGAGPAHAASFTASVGDAVSGTSVTPKATTLSLAFDVTPVPNTALNVGLASITLQLPRGVSVVTAPASACTPAALRAEPVPPSCAAAQVGSGTASGYGIGAAWSGPATLYRTPDGSGLNLRTAVSALGATYNSVSPVTVAPGSSGGSSLGITLSPVQVADNEFLDLRTLSLTLGAASAGSAVTSTSCDGSWAFGGTAPLRDGTSFTLAATQACTQGADPPPAPTVAQVLPALAPAVVLRRANARARHRAPRVLGTLQAIGGLRTLADGVAVSARCVSGCAPRRLAATTLQPGTPKAVQLRPGKPVAVTSATRIEVDATRTGWTGRFAVVRFALRAGRLVARPVTSGCLDAAGAHTACPRPA